MVIGGAGYIGSHFIRESRDLGHQCVAYDNLSLGHRESLPDDCELIEGDILDSKLLDENDNTRTGCNSAPAFTLLKEL